MFKAGRSRGNGGRGPRGGPPAPLDFSDMGRGLSVYGGGSMGAFSSDMVARWVFRAVCMVWYGMVCRVESGSRLFDKVVRC
jgi:hypothetical protein